MSLMLSSKLKSITFKGSSIWELMFIVICDQGYKEKLHYPALSSNSMVSTRKSVVIAIEIDNITNTSSN